MTCCLFYGYKKPSDAHANLKISTEAHNQTNYLSCAKWYLPEVNSSRLH